MKLGTKIIIVGFILFVIGVIGVELTVQGLHSEPRNMSDIPLWIRLVDDVLPSFLVYVGIITTIAGFIIRRKQNTGGMRDMRK